MASSFSVHSPITEAHMNPGRAGRCWLTVVCGETEITIFGDPEDAERFQAVAALLSPIATKVVPMRERKPESVK